MADADRAARLRDLKARKEAAERGEPKLRFRNYQPKDEAIAAHKEVNSYVGQAEEVEKEAEKVVKDAQEEPEFVNIVPKKANWDLKRDVEPKLEMLQQQTQRAIVELIKERLEAEEQ